MKYTEIKDKTAAELATMLKEKGAFIHFKTKAKNNATY